MCRTTAIVLVPFPSLYVDPSIWCSAPNSSPILISATQCCDGLRGILVVSDPYEPTIQAFVHILFKMGCFSHLLTFAFKYDLDDHGNGPVSFGRYSPIILKQKQLSLHSRTGKNSPYRVAISEIIIKGTTHPTPSTGLVPTANSTLINGKVVILADLLLPFRTSPFSTVRATASA